MVPVKHLTPKESLDYYGPGRIYIDMDELEFAIHTYVHACMHQSYCCLSLENKTAGTRPPVSPKIEPLVKCKWSGVEAWAGKEQRVGRHWHWLHTAYCSQP